MPGEHGSQGVGRPSSELDVPGLHEMQLLGVGDASVGEYFPAPQGVQEKEPVEEEYSPLGQSEQVSSEVAATESLYLPELQSVQVQVEDAEEVEYWPLRQSEHVPSEVADVELLNLPAMQEEQAEDAGEEEYWPWRQPTHADDDVAPSFGLLVPLRQSKQVASEVAAVELLNLPALQ